MAQNTDFYSKFVTDLKHNVMKSEKSLDNQQDSFHFFCHPTLVQVRKADEKILICVKKSSSEKN